jgi:hypothetical protein
VLPNASAIACAFLPEVQFAMPELLLMMGIVTYVLYRWVRGPKDE